MIQTIGQVMLYEKDIESAAQFWSQQMGFEWVEKQVQGEQISYIVAPQLDSQVQFVLHDKAQVAAQNPGMNLAIPSILMVVDDLEQTREELLARGVVVSPIADLGFMRVVNFPDQEGNYFAIWEGGVR